MSVNPVNVGSIGEYIRQQREQAKISLRQLASAAGVSNPYLSQIERGMRRPSAEILQQIAKGLRISAEALYVQAGILEDRRPDSGVRAAVLADPELTERQKQVLLEIYESFRREVAGSVTAGVGPNGAEPGGPAIEGSVLDATVLTGPVPDGPVPQEAPVPQDAQPAGPGRAATGRGAEAVARGATGTAGAAGAAPDGPAEPGPSVALDGPAESGPIQTGTRG